MPQVTAANYPTLTSPSTQASPTPGADYQQISGATPDAFGASVGRAQSQVGTALEQAGDRFEQAAIERQRLTNQIAADNADNYTMDEVQKILHGDPDKPGDVGYFGLKGDAALQARQPTMKRINDLLDNARGTLTNPRQQLMFDQQTRRMRNYWIGQVGQHYDTQLQHAAAASADGSIRLAQQQQASAAANMDEQGFGLGVQKEMEGVLNKAKNLGYGQEWIDAEFGRVRAAATKQWVESKAVKDPLGADKFLEQNKDALAFVPGEYQRLKGELRVKAEQQQAHEDVYGVPSGQRRTNPAKIQGGLVEGGAIRARVADMGTDAFLDQVLNYESEGGKNIPNYRFDRTHTAQGFFQITNSTWRNFAPEAGIDLNKYSNAMAAPYDVQRQVAKTILESPNGGGPQHWTNFNPGLNRAIMRGDTAPPKESDDLAKYRAEYDAIPGVKPKRGPGIPTYASPPEGKTSFEEWMALQHPDVPLTKVAAKGSADQLVRALPPLEEGQSPDAAIPGLPDAIQDLAKRLPAPDDEESRRRWDNAVKLVRRDMNMAYSNQQHQRRIQEQADKDSDKALTRQYDMRIGRDPTLTSDEILHDPRWKSPEAAHTAVGFFERQTKPDPASAVSKKNRREFFERIHLPDDNPDKIYSEKPFNDAYIRGDLTEPDRKGLETDFREATSGTNVELEKNKAKLLARAKPKIIPSTLFGKKGEEFIDPEGEERFARYEQLIVDSIKDKRQKNQNPADLFNPTKPDYLGRKEILDDPQYAPTMQQQLKDPKPAVPKLSIETAKTLEDFQALVKANPGQRDEIIQEALRRGLVRPRPAEVTVPVR